MGRIGTFFPHGMLDGTMKKLTGLDVVEQMVRKWEDSIVVVRLCPRGGFLQKFISIYTK
jgi:hypothetical protein